MRDILAQDTLVVISLTLWKSLPICFVNDGTRLSCQFLNLVGRDKIIDTMRTVDQEFLYGE